LGAGAKGGWGNYYYWENTQGIGGNSGLVLKGLVPPIYCCGEFQLEY